GPARGMRIGAPRPAERVRLRTGDRARIEVVADRAGHLTVFNVGPDGELNLLYPDDPSAAPPAVGASRPVRIDGVTMTPPAGRERLFAVWTSGPSTIRLDALKRLVERDSPPVSAPYVTAAEETWRSAGEADGRSRHGAPMACLAAAGPRWGGNSPHPGPRAA